jgi:hypothetical protein
VFTKVQDWAIARFINSVNSNPEVYIPDRKEADARLDLIGRLVVIRAGLIGLILGLLLFGLAFFLYENPSASGFSDVQIILILTVLSSFATAFELLFIYRDALRTAARMASILGIPKEELETVDLEHSIPHWLIHAALGAPGFKATMFGIDPLAHIGKIGHVIRKALGKVRIVVSATMFKIILRRLWARLIGRVAVRAYSMLAALPFFIFLNMLGTRSMVRDMRSRLVGHELTPKLVDHAFPEGISNISSGLFHEVYEGLNEHIQTARFMHPNQIRFLMLLPDSPPGTPQRNEEEQRRGQRFLLALSCMSGDPTRRCRTLLKAIEQNLGQDEASLVRQEIDDAIHDLTPLTRPWL